MMARRAVAVARTGSGRGHLYAVAGSHRESFDELRKATRSLVIAVRRSRSSPAVADRQSTRAGVLLGSNSADTRTAHRHTASSRSPSHLLAAAVSSLDTLLARVPVARPDCKRKPVVVERR